MKKLFAILLSLGLIIGPVPMAQASDAGQYGKMILGLANGIMGGSILLKCKMGSMQPSVGLYFMGGITYVSSEIAGAKAQGSKQKNLANKLEVTQGGGDYQKAVVQAQLDDERSTLDIIKKRRAWLLATKVVYALATAFAIMEVWWSFPPPIGTGKTDQSGCTQDGFSHKALEAAVVLGYSSFMASGGSLKGMAIGAAAGALAQFAFKLSIGDQIADQAISLLASAYGRIAFFGAATGIVELIDRSAKDQEEESERRISELEKVLATFGAPEEGLTGGDAGGGSGGTGGNVPAPTYALNQLPDGTSGPKNCFSSNGGQVNYSEASCKNSMKVPRPSFDASFNMPTLSAGANLAGNMAEAIANGDLGKASVEAAKLGSMAAKVTAIQKDLMGKLNDKLKKDGKKPIDVEGELKRQVTDLNNALNKQQPGSGNFSLADMQGKAETSETKKVEVAAVPDVKIPEATGPAESAVNLAEGNYGEAAPAENVATLDEKLGEFESTESDIAKDAGVSIFRQVSNRYLLNYTKIFPKKEINPPLVAPGNKK